MRNLSELSVPFLKPSEIKTKADAFRNKHWGNSLPVDIEQIIEFKLRINIIPVPELR